jgi:hypothetical protein
LALAPFGAFPAAFFAVFLPALLPADAVFFVASVISHPILSRSTGQITPETAPTPDNAAQQRGIEREHFGPNYTERGV